MIQLFRPYAIINLPLPACTFQVFLTIHPSKLTNERSIDFRALTWIKAFPVQTAVP